MENLELIERRWRVNGEPARLFVRVIKPQGGTLVKHQGGPRQNTRGTPGKTPGYSDYIQEVVDKGRSEEPSEEMKWAIK